MKEDLTEEATALNTFVLECAAGKHPERCRIGGGGRKLAIACKLGGRCGNFVTSLSIKEPLPLKLVLKLKHLGAVVWRVAIDKVVYDCTKRPHVYSLVYTLLRE